MMTSRKPIIIVLPYNLGINKTMRENVFSGKCSIGRCVRLLMRESLKPETPLIYVFFHFKDFANLAARTENKYAMPITESFTYDFLNRLDLKRN